MEEEREEQTQGPLLEILRDPIGVVHRRWKPMAAIAAAGLLISGVLTALQKPAYEARATVLIASQTLSEQFVQPTIEEDLLQRINALTGEALSRTKLTPIVEKYDLYPDVRAEDGMVAAVGALRSNLTVESDTKGQPRGARAMVLAITFSAPDPQLAANVTNDVATLFTDAGVRLRTQQTRLTTEFMKRELEEADQALREQSKKISDYQQAHRGELPSELEPNLRRLERLQQQRNSLATQIADAEMRGAMAVAQAPDSPASRLAELQAALARELAVNKETHPNVISLRRQIALLEKQGLAGGVSPARQILVGASQREVEQLKEQLAKTDAELKELDAKVAAIPQRQEELSGLLERQSVLRDNYLDFLRKVKASELAESLELAQQGDRVSVLDSAYPPTEPAHKRWRVLVAGLVGSLGLAGALGLLLELRDPVLISKESIESSIGVPVLGSVPHIV